MEAAINESNPKVMLEADSMPLLHFIRPPPRGDEDDGHPEGVLSTVDIAALNVRKLCGQI